MYQKPPLNAGEVGMRHYAILTGKTRPKNDNARRQPGEVGRSQQAHPKFNQPRVRLPAYARPIAELRRKGMRPDGQTVIVRLDCWPPKQHLTIADPESEDCCAFKPGRPSKVRWPQVVVPEDAQPAELDFGFVRDLDIVVAHWRSKSAPSRLRSLLRKILREEPRFLCVQDMERERQWIIKSISRGVEVEL